MLKHCTVLQFFHQGPTTIIELWIKLIRKLKYGRSKYFIPKRTVVSCIDYEKYIVMTYPICQWPNDNVKMCDCKVAIVRCNKIENIQSQSEKRYKSPVVSAVPHKSITMYVPFAVWFDRFDKNWMKCCVSFPKQWEKFLRNQYFGTNLVVLILCIIMVNLRQLAM